MQNPTIRDVLRSGIGVPIGVLAVLAMVVLPLPPLALDVLFTFNIALSLVVVMAVFYVARPLDFGVFPSVLLLATLLRMALNVVSTRVVLMHGHTGTDAGQTIPEQQVELPEAEKPYDQHRASYVVDANQERCPASKRAYDLRPGSHTEEGKRDEPGQLVW